MSARVKVVIGPAPCIACRVLVVFGTIGNDSQAGYGRNWRDPRTGRVHHCGSIG